MNDDKEKPIYRELIADVYAQVQDRLYVHKVFKDKQNAELRKRLSKYKMKNGQFALDEKGKVVFSSSGTPVRMKEPDTRTFKLFNLVTTALSQGILGNYKIGNLNRYSTYTKNEESMKLKKGSLEVQLDSIIGVLRSHVLWMDAVQEELEKIGRKHRDAKFFFRVGDDGAGLEDQYGNIELYPIEVIGDKFLKQLKGDIETINDTMLLYLEAPVEDKAKFDAREVVSNIFGD